MSFYLSHCNCDWAFKSVLLECGCYYQQYSA